MPIDGAWINDGKAVTAHEATHTICPYCFAEQEARRLEVERATRLDQRARQIG